MFIRALIFFFGLLMLSTGISVSTHAGLGTGTISSVALVLSKALPLSMGFFVFLPGIGDFIAVALGFLRANIWIVAISMFLGKAIRYWVWMEFVYKVQSMF